MAVALPSLPALSCPTVVQKMPSTKRRRILSSRATALARTDFPAPPMPRTAKAVLSGAVMATVPAFEPRSFSQHTSTSFSRGKRCRGRSGTRSRRPSSSVDVRRPFGCCPFPLEGPTENFRGPLGWPLGCPWRCPRTPRPDSSMWSQLCHPWATLAAFRTRPSAIRPVGG
jgi:hypothetical protein